MIPTQFSELTNQEFRDKLSNLTVKKEDGKVYLMADPNEAIDIIQETKNRLEAFDNVKKLFERPAYAKMNLDIMANYELELKLQVNNGGFDR